MATPTASGGDQDGEMMSALATPTPLKRVRSSFLSAASAAEQYYY